MGVQTAARIGRKTPPSRGHSSLSRSVQPAARSMRATTTRFSQVRTAVLHGRWSASFHPVRRIASPDGSSRIAYSSGRKGPNDRQLYWKAAGGAGAEEPVLTGLSVRLSAWLYACRTAIAAVIVDLPHSSNADVVPVAQCMREVVRGNSWNPPTAQPTLITEGYRTGEGMRRFILHVNLIETLAH